jgi:hypothetical protein
MEKLAHDDETMFERNIAIIASRRKEVQVFSGGFVYEGFLCGLDNKWLQIYGHEEDQSDPDKQWRFVLLGKDKISGIIPTGKSLYDVLESKREYVSKKTKTFADVCDKFLAVRGTSNESGRKENR